MAKFRKKPVVIDAEQWFPTSEIDGVIPSQDISTLAFIHTLEGTMEVHPGDWVITGILGEKYPCKPEIFVATYEPVSDSEEEDVVLHNQL